VTEQRGALLAQLMELALCATALLVQVLHVQVHSADLFAEAIGFGGQSRETIQRLMPEGAISRIFAGDAPAMQAERARQGSNL
jgi:hypothetical protein